MDQKILKVSFMMCGVQLLCVINYIYILYYSMLTCYKQFGTNWITVLMFVESPTMHI
jgi:hypothetical protein